MESMTREVERWQWHKTLEVVVEVLRMGSYSTSVIVKLPDDREIETDYNNLSKRGVE